MKYTALPSWCYRDPQEIAERVWKLDEVGLLALTNLALAEGM